MIKQGTSRCIATSCVNWQYIFLQTDARTLHISLRINDVNDHTPKFTDLPQTINVSEVSLKSCLKSYQHYITSTTLTSLRPPWPPSLNIYFLISQATGVGKTLFTITGEDLDGSGTSGNSFNVISFSIVSGNIVSIFKHVVQRRPRLG